MGSKQKKFVADVNLSIWKRGNWIQWICTVNLFDIHRKTSSKGDWVYMCLENLKYLEISESFEDIKQML